MDQDHLSVIIKAEGSWSQKLYQMMSSPSRVERLHVSVEGPYGPTSAHFLRSVGQTLCPTIKSYRPMNNTTGANVRPLRSHPKDLDRVPKWGDQSIIVSQMGFN